MEKILLATIIVDYKSIQVTCDYIKHFCSKLIGHEDMPFVIVDNSVVENTLKDNEFSKIEQLPQYKASYNEVIEAIRYRYQKHDVIYLKSNQNGGYARGNNIGAEYLKNVLNCNPRYILFTNNDIELTCNTSFSEIFDAFISDSTVSAIGPKILEKSGKQTSPRKKLSISRLLITYNINLILGNRIKKYVDDVEYTDNKQKVYWVMGCFLFVDGERFFDVGMFDTRTFLYSEEMILSEKFQQKCYSILYLPSMAVFHNHSQTIKKHVKSNTEVKYLYHSHRICCKYYRNANPIILLMADTVFAIYNIMFHVKKMIRQACKI